MDLSKEKLSDRDVDKIIAVWEVMKPVEPNAPEPLYIVPANWRIYLVLPYVFRDLRWERKMKKTWWRFFHDQYQTWRLMVTRHYNALAGDRDRLEDPQLMRLWEYQTKAQGRLHENTISQEAWNRQKAERRKARRAAST